MEKNSAKGGNKPSASTQCVCALRKKNGKRFHFLSPRHLFRSIVCKANYYISEYKNASGYAIYFFKVKSDLSRMKGGDIGKATP